MFHDNRGSLNGDESKAVAESGGTDPDVLKIKWLKEKWRNERYQNAGEAAQLMYPVLFIPAQPIHSAVITDNLSYFKLWISSNCQWRLVHSDDESKPIRV